MKDYDNYYSYFNSIKEKLESLEIDQENNLLIQQLIQGQKNILKYKSI